MKLTLALLLLAAAPPKKGPKPSEMAHLYFLAGDLPHAVESAKKCNELEGGKCKAMFKALAEYQFLASRAERLTPAEAKQFIAYDREISKTVPAKLTERVIARYVTEPLDLANRAAAAGDREQALGLAKAVLDVDPTNADARAMLGLPDAGR
ncbi:MAG: hypothetical protein K1X89_15700 [Myxococcaceae bacterium]|nr:hypothetical protein [Myxococcaceae bacterium]